MMVVFILLILSLACPTFGYELKSCNDSTLSSRQLCSLTKNYNPARTDFWTSGSIMNVQTEIALFQVANMDEIQETLTIDIIMSFNWNDTRLSLHRENNESKWYEIKEHDIEQIHVPLVRFNNIKDLRRIPNWGPKDSNYFWFRLPHNIQYFEAIQIKLFCSFTFTSYPFDSHYCDMTFGSSSNIDISVFYPQPNIFVDSGSMIQSKLPFHIHLETIAPFTQIILGSRYPNTGIRIHLARDDLGLLYGGFFGPTGLFSIMSLTSFTINPDAVPGRLGVLVTLSLIVSNVYNSIKAPPSRGFSYIEVWMIGIQIPILTAIIEYGIILCMKKYQQKQKDKIKRFDQVLDVDKLAIEMDKWTFLASLTFMLIFGPVYFFLAIRELERGLK